MRVNVYAEELPEKGEIKITNKRIDGHTFTGLRIPLYLPVTLPNGTQARGKFMHHEDDDDSSAITIWGKRDLRHLLQEALEKLDRHYSSKNIAASSGDMYIGAITKNAELQITTGFLDLSIKEIKNLIKSGCTIILDDDKERLEVMGEQMGLSVIKFGIDDFLSKHV